MKFSSLLFTILLFIQYEAFSETFVVTSNADGGPGTLREALTRAAANGNSEADFIYFDMPGVTPPDHTIRILSDLPEINSDVVIDASTQPGQAASLNQAKVIIDGTDRVYSPTSAQVFRINGVDRFELYGIVIRNFLYVFSGTTSSILAMEFSGINKNVVIGAPGKGNVMYNIHGINVNTRTDVPKHQIQKLTFQNNYLGVKENGLDIALPILTGLNLSRVYTVIIGGNSATEGNVIYGSVLCGFGAASELLTTNISVLVRHNIFTANLNEERPGITVTRNSVYHSFSADADLNHTGTVNMDISDNVFGASLSIGGLDNVNISVKRNFFGTSRDKTKSLPISSEALRFSSINGRILVGGSSTAEGNVVTNTGASPVYPKDLFAITAQNAWNVELSHNSLYCNPGIPFLYTYTGPFNKPLEIFLKEKTPTYVAGTTKPGARVELYYTDPECTNCQPKRYFATVTADVSGNWRYNGAIESGVSVMASATLNQMTSEFSDPRIYMIEFGEPYFKVSHQTCDDEYGKIERAFTVNADKVEWLNESGDVLTMTKDLLNVPAGKYKMRVNQFGCIVESDWVIVQDHRPALAFSGLPDIRHPSCGIGGSILNLFPNYTTIQWLDQSGSVKGIERELKNVPAGSYTLRVTGPTGCVKDFGPYVLSNVTGPSMDQSAMIVSNATCDASNGSIKNITATGSGTLTYTWKNAAGSNVAVGPDLINVRAGRYTLEVKDASACPPLVLGPIDIVEDNAIVIDLAALRSLKATCNASNGGIQGILVSGATKYEWIDASNSVVSGTLELGGVPSGRYRLVASNSSCSRTTAELLVDVAQSALNYSNTKIITPASCGLNNGKIEAIFTNQQPVSVFWKNSGGTVVASSRILDNQGAGDYGLYFIDDLGCERYITQYNIPHLDPVTINRSQELITHDRCGQGKGKIKAPVLTGGLLPYYYEWQDQDGTVVGMGPVLDQVKAGNYTLHIGDALICGGQVIDYAVRNEGNILPVPVVNDVKICSPGNALIQVAQPVGGTYVLYDNNGQVLSTNNTGMFSINVKESQSYSITYQFGDCESIAGTAKVTIENDGIAKLASAFSPNGDGVNDTWLIPDIENYPMAIVSIFNRYGEKVFASNGYKQPFDGHWKGKELPVGVYYYIIDLKRGCGLIQGSLSLIR